MPLKLLPVLATLLVMLSLPVAARAQGGVALEVSAGFDGYHARYSPGASIPTPVRVTLTNRSAGFTARVEVVGQLNRGQQVIHFVDVELPQNSSKIVTMYPVYQGFTGAAKVTVRSGDRIVAERQITLKPVDVVDLEAKLYGVLSTEPSLPPLAGENDAVANLTAAELPDRADALRALSALIVDNFDTGTLSEAQREALRDWVRLGGTLIIAGGANGAQAAAGLGDLVPVSVGGSRNARELSELADLAKVNAAPASGGGLANGRPVSGADVLAGTADEPLVVTRRLGVGSVAWLAWSPSTPPFRDWEGTAPLIRKLTATAPPPSLGGRLEGWSVNTLLQSVAGLQLPPTALVAGFLLLYSLILGPGLYFFLRRRDRKELAWILLPALTIFFSVLAYSSSFLIRSTGTVLRTLEVVDTYADTETERVTTYAGIFSPNRRSYDVGMPAEYTISGGPNADFGDPTAPAQTDVEYRVEASGNQTVIRDLSVDIYSFRTWTGTHVSEGQRPVLEARLTGDGRSVDGEVTNRSDAPVEDVYVYMSGMWSDVGTLGPGETRKLSGTSADIFAEVMAGPMDGGPEGSQARMQLLQSVTSGHDPTTGAPLNVVAPNEALVMGWQKRAAEEIRVLNARAQSSGERLIILHSPYELKSGQIRTNLEPRGSPLRDSDGVMEIEYTVPQGLVPESLSVTIQPFVGGVAEPGMMPPVEAGPATPVSDGGAQPPDGPPSSVIHIPETGSTVERIDIWNPDKSEYEAVRMEQDAYPPTGTIGDAARYVAKDGTVKLRVTNKDGTAESTWFRVEVDGRKD